MFEWLGKCKVVYVIRARKLFRIVRNEEFDVVQCEIEIVLCGLATRICIYITEQNGHRLRSLLLAGSQCDFSE
jgi:hypothetical protein